MCLLLMPVYAEIVSTETKGAIRMIAHRRSSETGVPLGMVDR